jgi:hypothetical protein
MLLLMPFTCQTNSKIKKKFVLRLNNQDQMKRIKKLNVNFIGIKKLIYSFYIAISYG